MFTRAKPDPVDRPRRFYAAAEAVDADGGFAVALDGRRLKTPAGANMTLPTQALAGLVAAEWAAQGDEIVVAAMPATRLAFTAIDRLSAAREEVAQEVARYAGSDLLCYFADAPEALALRQTELWRPVLDWAEAKLGLRLVTGAGISFQQQPGEALDLARALALRLDDFALAGLAHAAALFGSAVLAFALERGHLDGDAAFDLSRLDEAFQEAQWGVDAEAAERAAALRREAVALDHWFSALRT